MDKLGLGDIEIYNLNNLVNTPLERLSRQIYINLILNYEFRDVVSSIRKIVLSETGIKKWESKIIATRLHKRSYIRNNKITFSHYKFGKKAETIINNFVERYCKIKKSDPVYKKDLFIFIVKQCVLFDKISVKKFPLADFFIDTADPQKICIKFDSRQSIDEVLSFVALAREEIKLLNKKINPYEKTNKSRLRIWERFIHHYNIFYVYQWIKKRKTSKYYTHNKAAETIGKVKEIAVSGETAKSAIRRVSKAIKTANTEIN